MIRGLKVWVRFQLYRPRCSFSIWGCAGGLVLWDSTVRSEIELVLLFCKFTDRRRVISELVECTKMLLNTVVDDHPLSYCALIEIAIPLA
jgi:hypothetical protein